MIRRSVATLVLAAVALVSCGDSEPLLIESVEPPTAENATAKSTKNPNTITDGTYEVGQDIKAGKYRTKGHSNGCYVERLKDLEGDIDSIISNASVEGPGIIVIMKSDAYVKFSGGCIWKRS